MGPSQTLPQSQGMWGGGYWRLEMRLGMMLRYENPFGVE